MLSGSNILKWLKDAVGIPQVGGRARGLIHVEPANDAGDQGWSLSIKRLWCFSSTDHPPSPFSSLGAWHWQRGKWSSRSYASLPSTFHLLFPSFLPPFHAAWRDWALFSISTLKRMTLFSPSSQEHTHSNSQARTCFQQWRMLDDFVFNWTIRIF